MNIRRVVVWFTVTTFYIEQNQYFGWNWAPQSAAELMANGFTLVLLLLGIIYEEIRSKK